MTTRLNESLKPWYRHPWPWILMAGPFAVIVAGAVTVYLAVVSNDGLVSDDYYKQGLAVNQQTARDQRALALGLRADLMLSAEGESVRILLGSRETNIMPPLLRLAVTHPTRAGVDQQIQIKHEGGGVYTGRFATPLRGRWNISVEDEPREWRLGGEWVTDKNAILHLPVDAPTQAR